MRLPTLSARRLAGVAVTAPGPENFPWLGHGEEALLVFVRDSATLDSVPIGSGH